MTRGKSCTRDKRAAFGFRRFAHDRIRSLLDAGKPNWTLLNGLTPRWNPKRHFGAASPARPGMRPFCFPTSV